MQSYLSIREVVIIQVQAQHIDPDSGSRRDLMCPQHHILCRYPCLHKTTQDGLQHVDCSLIWAEETFAHCAHPSKEAMLLPGSCGTDA